MKRLPRKVKELIEKSRASAILAVDIYNKPATKFRSFSFIVLMNIAWTSLFHSIFERNGIKYFYRKDNSNRYIYTDGQKRAWHLNDCMKEYFRDQDSPVRVNLRFFIGLRHQIEHRFLPALDLDIFGECQALLHNYVKLLTQEFGEDYSLGESLAIPLQLLTVDSKWRNNVLKEIQSREYEAVKGYIDTFRYSLDDTVWDSSEYNFKIFLVPRLGNRQRSADIAVEFIPYDKENPEEMEKYKKVVAFIKEKQVPVVNPGKLKPGDVSQRIEQTLGITFHPSSHHARCWKYYKVRPSSNSESPEKTKIKYCQYDLAHGDYVYTEEWVEFLISELSDIKKRKEILEKKG
ncbi:MAG: Uncharacterized protein XD79_0362 [Atribacteria bacterium 34_128]|nr:MAG: Uncharacterized protein XD79_0362 [Atribacteria bacterium 34_128]